MPAPEADCHSRKANFKFNNKHEVNYSLYYKCVKYIVNFLL